MSERKVVTKEVARRSKKASKKGRRSMKNGEGIMEEHPPLIPPIKGEGDIGKGLFHRGVVNNDEIIILENILHFLLLY